MCTRLQLDTITSQIIQAMQNRLGEKLDGIWLYGSYARGDFDSESDIDIMVLADVSADEANRIDRDTVSLTSRLGLEHDILISLCVKDCETFYKWKDVVPFYQNVLRDGVKLSA